MNLEKRFKMYRDMESEHICEEKMNVCIRSSIEAFYASEQEKLLSYQEFLWVQFRFIQKRWWILQTVLLLLFWILLTVSGETVEMKKAMGVIGTLFIVLIVPELWKNRANQSTEIEGTSLYSLKQIYAARMILFMMADVLLLSVFCAITSYTLQIALLELMVEFILPMSVTACICFQSLCNRIYINEAVTITLCLLWSAVWVMVILNKSIYAQITHPVWLILLGMSIFYLGVLVYRTLSCCNICWEEKKAWN